MNVVCLSIDRFHAGYLPPYGNTWIAAPWFDALASQSALFHQALAPSADWLAAASALGLGRHPLEPAGDCGAGFVRQLRGTGYRTLLATDDRRLSDLAPAFHFEHCLLHEAHPVSQRASAPEATHLAALLALAADSLTAADAPQLLWVHTQGLAGPWDAPVEFFESYLDPDDTRPDDLLWLPDEQWPPDFDPDRRTAIAHAYAGQVALLDHLLALFDSALAAALPPDETLLVVVGLRGVALGEHGCVGRGDDRLPSSVVQVPLICRFPDRRGALLRSQALVQTCDLPATLLEACCIAAVEPASRVAESLLPLVEGRGVAWRDRLIVQSSTHRALRTAAWYLIESLVPEGSPHDPLHRRLYAKPDDFWDLNEVADRCHAEVEQLAAALAAWCRTVSAGQPPPTEPLAHLLTSTLRG